MNKQRETTSRPQQVRNHWQKVKETETKPWQFILPVVLFIGSLILVSGIAGTIKNTFVFIVLLVLLISNLKQARSQSPPFLGTQKNKWMLL